MILIHVNHLVRDHHRKSSTSICPRLLHHLLSYQYLLHFHHPSTDIFTIPPLHMSKPSLPFCLQSVQPGMSLCCMCWFLILSILVTPKEKLKIFIFAFCLISTSVNCTTQLVSLPPCIPLLEFLQMLFIAKLKKKNDSIKQS